VSWFNRLLNLRHREDLGRELDEELQFHIDARVRDNLKAGMTEEAARRDARRRFGNWTLAKKRTHEVNIIVTIQTVGQDLRYALRSLRKSPGFTALAVLAIALGIGANTAVFTVVNGVLLRPLPLVQPERLFLISYQPRVGPLAGRPWLSDHDYLEFQRRTHAFERVTAFNQDQVTMTGAGDAIRLPAGLVTSSFFPVLRVSPAMGRAFTSQEQQPGAPGVAVLSQGLWRSRFAADPNILGKSITVDGIKRSVIGVMPAGFAFPRDAALWLPLTVGADPVNYFFTVAFGRLRPSVTQRQAQAEWEALAPQLPHAPEDHRNGWGAEVLPLQDLLVGQIRKSLLIFMGAVAFVLLIACANVANLLLMKGSLRRQEMAVRAALGAPRSRLIRQLLTESAMLSLGAIAGLLSAIFGVRGLLALAPAGIIPRVAEIHLDARVIGFALGLGAVTGILFGLLPAVQATGRELRTFLSQAGRAVTSRSEGLRSLLVVSEIALTLVLLTGAGLLLKSFLRMRAVDPGFRAENVLTMTVDLPESLYNTTVSLQAFHARTLEKLSSMTGVLAAGAVNWLPLNDALMWGLFHLYDGRPTPRGYMVDKPAVSSEYFRVMGIPLLSGRAFSDQDSSTAPRVAIISQSVARTFWPGGDALGQRITLEAHPRPGNEDWLTIVGVVDDVRQASLTEKAHPAIYQPYAQVKKPDFLSRMTFAIRTAAQPASMATAMRGVLREVDRNQPAQSITTMTDLVAKTTAEPQLQARLIAIFSMLALLLAAIGVYGVLACAVAERTREIGIRMALGAEKSDITRMVLRRSLLLVTVGVALGVVGALAVTRVLARFLFEVKPTDLPTFLVVAALLVAVALLAGLLPARRATRVDPMAALRWE
jgi:predicted permease